MRVNIVKKARKAQGVCERCRKELAVGDPYIWIKPRYGAKRTRCPQCRFRPSDMTSSDKLSTIYAATEAVEDDLGAWDGPVADIQGSLESAAESVREAAEGYEESASNMEEHFEGSYQVDEIREKAEMAEEFAQQIDDCASEIESLEPGEYETPTKPCPECGDQRKKLSSKATHETAHPPEGVMRKIKATDLREGMRMFTPSPNPNVIISRPEGVLSKVENLEGPKFGKGFDGERDYMTFHSGMSHTVVVADGEGVQVLKDDVEYVPVRRQGTPLWEWKLGGQVVEHDASDLFPDCETCGGDGEVELDDDEEWRDEVIDQIEGVLAECPL